MCGTIHLIIFAATVDIHTGDGSIITQMDYFTLAVSRLDHGLNTFLLSMDVLLNARIPTVHVPFGTFLNVAVTVPSLRFSFL